MDVDTLGPRYWRLDEDGGHLFMKRKAVKFCWRLLDLERVAVW